MSMTIWIRIKTILHNLHRCPTISATFTIDQYNQLMNLLAQQKTSDKGHEFAGNALLIGNHCLLSVNHNNDRLLDNGAYDHMCSSLTLFDTYTSLPIESNITIPDGTKVKITHTGTVKPNHSLVLKNFLFVPTFQFNLISIHNYVKIIVYLFISLLICVPFRGIQ